MYRLALNMLFGDRAKLAMLLCGLAFSALLMAQQSSVFFGIMSWTYTPMVNIRAQVWVSDPMVEQVNDAKPLRDTDLGRVRSVDGVAWAAPLHTSFVQGAHRRTATSS
jgi:putative ABC transport system permease protein